jgi:hypothetical protein
MSRHFDLVPTTSGFPQQPDIFSFRRRVSNGPTTEVRVRFTSSASAS